MNGDTDRAEMIDRHLRGELSEEEKARLAELLDSDPAARSGFVEQARWDAQLTEALRGRSPAVAPLHPRRPSGRSMWLRTLTSGLTVAGVAAVAVVATLFLVRPDLEPTVARITGLSGPVRWTGNAGRVTHDLAVGAALPGGTVEGMAPDSWFEMEFNDGSTVTIHGSSAFTFSDAGRKVLWLKEGSFSADVVPQTTGKPMLVHTRSAVLTVVGTRFEVEVELAATVLNVAEGEVEVERLSDGASASVRADHRLIAAADREMSPVRVPRSRGRWRSRLEDGPAHTLGKWSPASEGEPAGLKTIPFTTEEGKTIYAVGMGVSRGDNPPVVLRRDSRFRVRGRIAKQHRVFFGVTLQRRNGEFAGRFQVVRPAEDFPAGEFDVVLPPPEDYHRDPTLDHIKDQLPDSPADLVLADVWCHTLFDQVGLEITAIELVTPDHGVRD